MLSQVKLCLEEQTLWQLRERERDRDNANEQTQGFRTGEEGVRKEGSEG